jgi:hypothetical protein
MTWSFVAQHMLANGFDPLHTPVFLASDNQRPNITRAFLMRSNVKSFVAIGRLQPPVDARLIDMYVLTKSALFIGHPLSSLSFHVALWRELDGWPTNTNILAGYKERGYLHHLFDNFD